MADFRLCSVPGCGKRHYGNGLCQSHWNRNRRHGDPLGGRTPYGEPAKFYNNVVLPYEGDDCLIWPYAKDSKGYGQLRRDGKAYYVSRLVCEATNGPAPSEKHQAAHSCGNGHLGCVAPNHLRWATVAQNTADMIAHGTRRMGDAHPNSKLSERDVIAIKNMAGSVAASEMAQSFGVSEWTVRSILAGQNWGWLTPSQE